MKQADIEPCQSGTSSTISASPQEAAPPSLYSQQHRHGKQAYEEEEEDQEENEQETISHIHFPIDLMKSNEDPNHEMSTELNLIDCFNMGSSDQSSSETSQATESEPRVFSCKYCQRKFNSSHALGGHQNAHMQEQIIAKRNQRIGATIAAIAAAFGHPYLHHHHHHQMQQQQLQQYNYSNIVPSPLLSSPNR